MPRTVQRFTFSEARPQTVEHVAGDGYAAGLRPGLAAASFGPAPPGERLPQTVEHAAGDGHAAGLRPGLADSIVFAAPPARRGNSEAGSR
jgi:hypothetical protein